MNNFKHFALIGFVNSGKSTFFNLILNHDKAGNKKAKTQIKVY
jgi:50S ribosomal subunit-associated GTPase HflX